MPSLNPHTLRSNARSRLSAADRDPRQLVLIHTGVVLLLTLFCSGLSLYLDNQIGGTGGLSGLGTRSILQSMQAFLQYGTMLFSPFWQAGFALIALRWADGADPKNTDLLSGFRRAAAVLAYQLLLFLLFFITGTVCAYVASIIFSMTPLSEPLMTILEPLVISGAIDMTALESLPTAELMNAIIPMLVIYLVILVPVILFLLYNLRLTTYFIMDDTHLSAFSAMRASFRSMRGNRLKMLKLDLSFWWYYVLEGILIVICYLDVLLSLFGITLPFNPTVVYFVTLILYCILELLLSLWMKAQVDTTYALAYRSITAPPTAIQTQN